TLLDFYARAWTKEDGKFYVEYSYGGDPIQKHESPAAYAMSLPAFAALQSPLLTDVLAKIQASYNNETNSFADKANYYENSLTLLGLIFLNDATTNTIDLRMK
ncbi:MAG: cellulase, partial [Candidatus Binatia bacterium]